MGLNAMTHADRHRHHRHPRRAAARARRLVVARQPSSAPQGRRLTRRVPASGVVHVQEPARRALRRRSAACRPRSDGPIRRRASDDRREPRQRDRVSARSREHPDRFFGSIDIDPNQGMGAVRALRHAVEELGVKALAALPVGTIPQRAVDDADLVPDVRHVHRPRHPVRAVHGNPRTPGAVRATARDGPRPRVLRVPRVGGRDPPRVRAVGRPDGQAHAQVAEPALLHVGVRTEVLPEARSSTTRTPAAPIA